MHVKGNGLDKLDGVETLGNTISSASIPFFLTPFTISSAKLSDIDLGNVARQEADNTRGLGIDVELFERVDLLPEEVGDVLAGSKALFGGPDSVFDEIGK